MLYQVIEDGEITQSYSMPDHDDTHHITTAKRNTANGIAGLDSGGDIIAPGTTLKLTRDVADNISISELTSGEYPLYFNRVGSDNFRASIKAGGSYSQVLLMNITSVNADTTLGDEEYTVLVDAVGGAKTITLPAAGSYTDRIYNIKKIDASANTVTIDGNAAETIDGAATLVIAAQWDSYTIQSNGTEWFII